MEYIRVYDVRYGWSISGCMILTGLRKSGCMMRGKEGVY